MAKYLVVSKESDYISSSRNIKKHMEKTTGDGVMIYDNKGILINSCQRESNGSLRIDGATFYDGEPRKWAKKCIKDNPVGFAIADASLYKSTVGIEINIDNM